MAFDRRETALLLIGDFLILAASLWVALLLRNFAVPSFGYFEANFVPFVPMFLISLVVFYIAGLYEKQTRPIRRVMGARIFGAQATTVGIAAVLFFILPLTIAPKTILVLYLIVSVIAETLWRFYRINRDRAAGKRTRALLIGSGAAVSELFEEVNANSRYLITFVARLDPHGLSPAHVAQQIKEGAQAAVIDTSDPDANRLWSALYGGAIREEFACIEFASLYEEVFDRVPLEHFDAHELVRSLPKNRAAYDLSKRIFDALLAAVLAVIAIPFIAVAAVVLWFEGGAPFIRAERIGRDGRTIRLHKLRTMLFNDKGDPELQKQNRVTPFGRLLRKSRIDELPQLWDVLAGELSFIGPRPEFPAIAQVYEREVPQYRLRHLIAPGLSGWAQIHDYDAPRGGADVARTRRKVSYDLYYLKHRSFGLDIAIALKTLRALASFSGT